jgi:hypothetical protein
VQAVWAFLILAMVVSENEAKVIALKQMERMAQGSAPRV